MNQKIYDMVIIGAGPAGLTAALYAGRYRLETLLFEKAAAGGQILLSSTIDNFPGFPGGIATEALIERFKKQVEEVGVSVVQEEVEAITPRVSTKPILHEIKTSEARYLTKSMIIASGAQAKRLGVPGEEKLIGRGVSYCATCDGPLFRNKEIAVIGGGDKAIEEALFLTSYASKVTLIHRRQVLRAAKILEEKARANSKIVLLLESVVEEITGADRVEGIKIKNLKDNAQSFMACQGVFIFVGILPNTAFTDRMIQKDEGGFIITDSNQNTSEEGIFACGDCIHKSLYQVVNACGEGATAVHTAQSYLVKL